MKKTSIPAGLLCLNLIALTLTTTAQDHPLPGYIVKTSGDTLRGFLKEQGTGELLHQIAFKTTATGDYTTYSFDQVSSFQYQEGNLYRAISFNNVSLDQPLVQMHYARLLVSGEYDLYSFTEKDRLFFLVKKDTSFHLLFDDDIHVGTYIKGNFRNELNFFAAFCESIRNQIEPMVYGEHTMMEFFQKLDACLAPNKTVVSYYHKTKVVVGFEAYGGGISLGTDRSQFTAEARVKFSFPQYNPSISLNVGVRYAQVIKKVIDPTYLVANIYHKATYDLTSIPLTFQYTFLPHATVQPFICAGLSALTMNIVSDLPLGDFNTTYYHKLNVAPVLGGGVDVKITHFLKVRAEMRFENIVEWPTVGVLLTF
jgi:hypothetical protein